MGDIALIQRNVCFNFSLIHNRDFIRADTPMSQFEIGEEQISITSVHFFLEKLQIWRGT